MRPLFTDTLCTFWLPLTQNMQTTNDIKLVVDATKDLEKKVDSMLSLLMVRNAPVVCVFTPSKK